MPCFSQREPQQTEQERRTEVKKALTDIEKLVAKGKVKIKIGPQGAAVLVGLSEADRRRLTDTCILQRLMVSGSEKVKQAITQAEMMAGRRISKSVVESGLHSHDGGRSWHPKG